MQIKSHGLFMYNTVILEEDLKYYPGRLSLARHFLGPK